MKDTMNRDITRNLLELYEYITMDELAERIGVSVSSIRHRMTSIKELFASYQIKVINTPKKGIKLEAKEADRDRMLYDLRKFEYTSTESAEYRRNYILKTLFEYSKTYTAQLFAEDLFVSPKTISRDLQEVRKLLNRFHVELKVRKNSGISLVGHEFDVRQAIVSYNNSLWWDETYLTRHVELDVRVSDRAWTYMNHVYGKQKLLDIQYELQDAERELHVQWTDIAFSRLWEYLIVAEQRIQKKWMITEQGEIETLLIDPAYLKIARSILEKITSSQNIDLEVEYLAARIFVAESVRPRSIHSGDIYKDAIRIYLEYISNALAVSDDLRNDNILLHQLCDLLITMKYRSHYRIVDWNDLHRDIQRNVQKLYAACFAHIYVLEEMCKLRFQQDDIASVTLLIYNSIRRHKPKAVFCVATDRATAEYQLEKLKKSFPELSIRRAIHYQDFDEEIFDDYFVITTVPLKRTDRLIEITKHVNPKDLQNIKETLQASFHRSMEKTSDYYIPDLIMEISAKDKNDAISQMCKKIVDKGWADTEIEDAIHDREEIAISSIGNGIAIPNIYKEHLYQEFIVVARLKHSIMWNANESVKTIFLSGIMSPDSQKPYFFSEIINWKIHTLLPDEIDDHDLQSETK